jgi:hypothetical protein
MRKLWAAVWTAVLIAGALRAQDPEQAVLAAQRRWIESYNRRDDRALSEIEADDFRVTFGDGRLQDRADQLAQLRKPVPKGAEFEIAVEESDVHVYGTAAVVRGIVTERGRFVDTQGLPQNFRQRSRYTDTWILQNGRWRVVASHLSDLKM